METLYAFFAGLLTFFSPCVLPLLPSYLAYIGGLKVIDGSSNQERMRMILHVLFFILGFSLVFTSFGFAGSLLSKILVSYKTELRIISGGMLVFLGLLTLDLIPLLPLYRHLFLTVKERNAGVISSLILGFSFAASWSPCIGPALSSVLIISLGSEDTISALLPLLFFSAGLAIPFFLSSLLFDRVLVHFSLLKGFTKIAKLILGFLLIIFGLFLLSGLHQRFIQEFLRVLNSF